LALLENASQRTRPMVRAERAAVVGDTPHDIAVAIAAGARSIGVATGSHSIAALQAAGADHVFEDLSDTDAVLQALG
jgi:phosphoglycolate phosphatase-like HAD superfamily hydrolase